MDRVLSLQALLPDAAQPQSIIGGNSNYSICCAGCNSLASNGCHTLTAMFEAPIL
jgi:hypothetical protein